MNNNGALVISLDFELLWGVFDKVNWREKKGYFQNTRKIIPEILHLFEKYEISCTWATVGMLFNENWDEWNYNIPKVLPDYNNEKLSAYSYGKTIQSKETEGLCFAPDLIKRIRQTPGQEIGTHTYSHYYCLEPGQTLISFKADLVKARELANKFSIEFKSLVFPRNQYNEDYLDECKYMGLRAVRTNPDVWYWKNTQQESLQQKIFRTADAYLGFNNRSYQKFQDIHPEIFGQKASRLLRPHSGKILLDKARLKRVKSEMSSAAFKKEIYHLWWHPHNFGTYPEKGLEELENLLKFYIKLKCRYNFSSLNMVTVAQKKFKI
ncbi:polysaccharide deacetylase family protein [Salinimicrobium soli]|uniref:polysaccharide deacetylase family protein n=1 Tax=Salinimicrobium soli TaxID=1254399 RepID=UPI003AAD4C8C